MEHLSFFEGTAPSGYTIEFDPFMFSEAAHRYLQSDLGWHSFHVLDKEKKSVLGSAHFHLEEGKAKSPFKSPFGSFQLSQSVLPEQIFEFLKFVEVRLKSHGANSVTIKHYPFSYSPDVSVLLSSFFLNLGYHVQTAEVSSAIEVSDAPIEDFFHRSEIKRLDKATQAALTFTQLNQGDFGKVYAFIESCRQEKKYALSMTQKELSKVIQKFPDRIKLFGVFKDDELIAASICIAINHTVLYDFYHDHTSRFDNLSPVVFLVAGIYGYCRDRQIKLLDLGTSSVGNLPNFPLLRFKNNLGGKPSLKLTFEKQIG